MLSHIDKSPDLFKKAFHDIKNPLANLVLLTEINNPKIEGAHSSLLYAINIELWKVVATLEMFQVLSNYPSNGDVCKATRIDDCIDEAIGEIHNIDSNFRIDICLSDDIEASQLIMPANSPSLTKLFYFLIRQLHLQDPISRWYIFITYTSQKIELFFSKINNLEFLTRTNKYVEVSDTDWQWIAAQKIAQYHNFKIKVLYDNEQLACMKITN